jgi:hypothetical protein
MMNMRVLSDYNRLYTLGGPCLNKRVKYLYVAVGPIDVTYNPMI